MWEDFSATRKVTGLPGRRAAEHPPGAGDVPDSRSALLNFDGISYAKGASVLRQLMATVGEDAFLAGVRAYVDRHAFGNTVFADLLAELETASGRDLEQWARVWLQTSGRQHAAPGRRAGDGCGSGRSRRCSGRTGSAWGCTTSSGTPWCCVSGWTWPSRARSPTRAVRRGRAGPAAAQRR
jgi:aminopeptidase N